MNRPLTLEGFATRLRGHIAGSLEPSCFNELALELFALQFQYDSAYRRFCQSRGLSPAVTRRWEEIPAVPSAAFKEDELSCLPEDERSTVFYSSGTTRHRPSRHFHNNKSLEVYEASLLGWFAAHLLTDVATSASAPVNCLNRMGWAHEQLILTGLALTPAPAQAPHSSLVHMFEALRRNVGFSKFTFTGTAAEDGTWNLDCSTAIALLQRAVIANEPVLLFGTAFSYVHLLDHMAQLSLGLRLPTGSRALETGGYKGRSRVLPKSELHSLITSKLGIPPSRIVCEYGMSELSSQAYDRVACPGKDPDPEMGCEEGRSPRSTCFHFPPWVRVQVVSPETGQPVEEGQTGLIRVFDLANVYSVMAVQTEDLAVRRGDGFELVGRAALAEARGCSLLAQQP